MGRALSPVAACVLLLLSGPARADAVLYADPVPFSDAPARVEGAHVVAAALGQPSERLTKLGPRRLSARRVGEVRGRAMLRGWLDDACARLRVSPQQVDALHRALTRHAEVRELRPLVDGSAVVVVGVELAVLRRAAAVPNAPWSP